MTTYNTHYNYYHTHYTTTTINTHNKNYHTHYNYYIHYTTLHYITTINTHYKNYHTLVLLHYNYYIHYTTTLHYYYNKHTQQDLSYTLLQLLPYTPLHYTLPTFFVRLLFIPFIRLNYTMLRLL